MMPSQAGSNTLRKRHQHKSGSPDQIVSRSSTRSMCSRASYQRSLVKHFLECVGGPDTHRAAEYILWSLMQLMGCSYRFTLSRSLVAIPNTSLLISLNSLTQATDTGNIQPVVADVKETILRNALKILVSYNSWSAHRSPSFSSLSLAPLPQFTPPFQVHKLSSATFHSASFILVASPAA